MTWSDFVCSGGSFAFSNVCLSAMGISFFRNLVDDHRVEPGDDVCGRTSLAADD